MCKWFSQTFRFLLLLFAQWIHKPSRATAGKTSHLFERCYQLTKLQGGQQSLEWDFTLMPLSGTTCLRPGGKATGAKTQTRFTPSTAQRHRTSLSTGQLSSEQYHGVTNTAESVTGLRKSHPGLGFPLQTQRVEESCMFASFYQDSCQNPPLEEESTTGLMSRKKFWGRELSEKLHWYVPGNFFTL